MFSLGNQTVKAAHFSLFLLFIFCVFSYQVSAFTDFGTFFQVLRNDVLSHHATVENVNGAGAELLESSPGDEASHLRDQLDQLNQSWQSLLLKTQERQKQLEAALQQVLQQQQQ